jgi:alpha-ketoglutarate-dependent taurine dioxygenase
MAIEITAAKEHIGAVVTGAFVDRTLVDGAARAIAAALDRYGALVFPGVDLADQAYIDFGHELGELVVLPRGQVPGFPEIEAISRDPGESPQLAKYREGAFLWHIDGTTTPNPHRATILSCRRIAEGDEGDTELANTYAAYDALSDADKALIDGLQVQHTFAAAQRKAFPNASEKVQASWNDAPSRVHPLAVERYDGRKWLMVGATTDHVIGMDPAESRALLDRMDAWVTQPQFVLRHRWTQGDLVMFDNQGVLHRAMQYSAESPRLMHRIMVQARSPVAA